MKNKAIVFVGTYPPRECGIATFTQDLLNSCKKSIGGEIECKVAAFNVSALDKHVYPPEVEWEIVETNKKQHLQLAKEINSDPKIKGVILQHEYGIYGGYQGQNILILMENCMKPILVTLHTVLPKPTAKMKEVTEKIVAGASAIVVLTHNSKRVLEEVYPMSKGKVSVIPHGVHNVKFTSTAKARKKLRLGKSTILSTFGLLSRGKGIEYVIRALPEVVSKNRKILYLVLGKTHPSVHRLEGESYRKELIKLVKKLRLTKHVKFYDQYLNLKDLFRFLKATDIYVSTSINPNQAVSGTLSYAMGTGRAVVSTEFSQAKEIITSETGRLVPIKDPASMSKALNELLKDRKYLKIMHQKAYEITRSMLWSNVGDGYIKLLGHFMLPEIKLDYLNLMTDEFGIFQFAKYGKPNKKFGYTADDNARALIVAHKLNNDILKKIYLDFLNKCRQPNNHFINYINFDKSYSAQNRMENLEEANSRIAWALAEVNQPFLVPADFTFLRPKALAIKAMAIGDPKNGLLKKYADDLVIEFENSSIDPEWQWYEKNLSYNNGVLPESLLLASETLKNKNYFEVGKKSLDFLISKTFGDEYYSPIGNSKWPKKGEEIKIFDQQPEDTTSMILALKTIYKITKDIKYRNLASICFSWFLGNNSSKQSVYNETTGGCFDGITPKGVNLNQGAESLLSYLLARLAMEEINK